ncbi:DUF2345 domain-containing protein [Paraburkholderia sediminicola]|uniref:DUF2345 domain-containing protein n=1 Tax=Paraburkholderia sediminicola TaxID=458836 RepID=UPI0038BCAAE4
MFNPLQPRTPAVPSAALRTNDLDDLPANQHDVTKAIKAQNDAIRGGEKTDDNPFPEFAEPHLTLSSPAGIQTTTAGSTHISSDEHLALTTGGHVSIAAGKSLFAAIRESCSIFAYRLGMRLIAAAGKVRIESQSDNVETIAKRAVEIMSTEDWINLTSKHGIQLNGGGSELKLSPKGILGFTNDAFRVNAAVHQTLDPRPKPVRSPLTDTSQAKVAEHFVLVEHGSGLRLPNQHYRITLSSGQVIEGTSNELGETELVLAEAMQIAISDHREENQAWSCIGPWTAVQATCWLHS